MSHSAIQTKQRILKAALPEFRRRGYSEASLRRIAAAAHVTTGAIYNHFGSKEGLLDALVREPAQQLLSAWSTGRAESDSAASRPSVPVQAERPPERPRNSTDTAAPEALAHSADRTDAVLSLVYEHADVFELLLCHARGTRYEHFSEQLAQIEEEAYRRLPGLTDSAADRLFVRSLASDGVEALRTVLGNGLNQQEARTYIDRITHFRLYGWAGILAQASDAIPASSTRSARPTGSTQPAHRPSASPAGDRP